MAMALRSAHVGQGSMSAAVAHGVDTILDTLALWRQRAATRRELSRLDDRMLRDIGISSVDVDSEVSKHFWQP